MHISPKDKWREYPLLIGSVLFWLAMVVMPIPVLVMGIMHPPILWLLLFFLALVVVHLLVVHGVVGTRLGYVGVVACYTLVVDVPLLVLQGRPTVFLVFAPVITAILLLSTGLIEFLVNHHIARNILARLRHPGIEESASQLRVESLHRHLLNTAVWFAFYVTVSIGYVREWPTTSLFLHFFEMSVLSIAVTTVGHLLGHASRLASSLHPTRMPDTFAYPEGDSAARRALLEFFHGGWLHHYPDDDLLTRLVNREQRIDFFDRCGEARRLTYYSSLALVGVLGTYLSVYSLVPRAAVSLSPQHVVVVCVAIAVVAIQIPFFIGQKKLAMQLAAPFSGSDYREMLHDLEDRSPAWTLIRAGELLGAGASAPLLAWAAKLVGAHLNIL